MIALDEKKKTKKITLHPHMTFASQVSLMITPLDWNDLNSATYYTFKRIELKVGDIIMSHSKSKVPLFSTQMHTK